MKKMNIVAFIMCFVVLISGCQSTTGGGLMSFPSSDESLTTSVLSAFMVRDDLSSLPIHVEAHGGEVFLSGYVKTIRQADTAGEVAGKVPGVKSVQNGLIVRK